MKQKVIQQTTATWFSVYRYKHSFIAAGLIGVTGLTLVTVMPINSTLTVLNITVILLKGGKCVAFMCWDHIREIETSELILTQVYYNPNVQGS